MFGEVVQLLLQVVGNLTSSAQYDVPCCVVETLPVRVLVWLFFVVLEIQCFLKFILFAEMALVESGLFFYESGQLGQIHGFGCLVKTVLGMGYLYVNYVTAYC